jgi:dCMP deaminase
VLDIALQEIDFDRKWKDLTQTDQKLQKAFNFVSKEMNEAKQRRYDISYLKMAEQWANLSHCSRKKVGALIVKDQMIISDGYNGTPAGFDNCCENDQGETHWYVLHAEANAILKVAKSTNNSKGATLYLTMSPCKDCSKLILQAGIKRLVYSNVYKDTSGIEFLKEAGIDIVQIDIEEHGK